jgi:hypothetical protein
MDSRRKISTEFWYDFDNQTLWQRTPEIDDVIQRAYGQFGGSLDAPAELFALSHRQPNHPTPFLTAIQPSRQGFLDLAEAQRRIVAKHFGADGDALRQAFEDFGQGVLYDPRPPRVRTRLIHMMDGTPTNWVGYHRWHACLRAAMLLGAEQAWYLHFCRVVALAWGIQTETNPQVDRPDNPGMAADRLRVLSDFWLRVDLATLDRAFVTFRPGAPRPEELARRGPRPLAFAAAAVQTRFTRVQEILERAAGDGFPFHEGQERFWNRPLADFLALPPIYGVDLIAPAGPDRGARSGLIKALKGERPFGPGGQFPRMPLNRPPVAPDDIAFIQKWIDDNCPDDPIPPRPAA